LVWLSRPGLLLGLLLVLSVACFAGDAATDRGDLRIGVLAPRHPVPTYKVEAGIDGEIFPVFANYASLQKPQDRKWGMVAVTVTNPTDEPVRQRIAVRVEGWSDQEIQIAEMGAGQVKTYLFAPTFHDKFYENREIKAATADVEISDMGGHTIFETTLPVRLRSSEDMYWGSKFKYAPFIASWITPHDARVETVLASAKELMPGRRLPGYESWKSSAEQEKSTYLQAKALYRAVQIQGVSYVKSSLTFGHNTGVSQRVRKPKDSLTQNSANCIDSVVLFASLFENLGMDPLVMLVPGHAYVGVRVAHGSQHYLFIDVALAGRMSFDAAVKSAENGLQKYDATQVTRIPIDAARSAGIYPMP
jgi:hypothetical protein